MPRFVATARNTAVTALAALADGGSVEFRTGPAPTNPEDAAQGTLLVTVDAQNPAFGSASDGVVTAAGLPLTSTGVDDGTIGHARVLDSDGDPVYDEDDISTEGSSKITVNTMTVSTGVDFEITSWTITARNPSS